jgi:hypothetical protein
VEFGWWDLGEEKAAKGAIEGGREKDKTAGKEAKVLFSFRGWGFLGFAFQGRKGRSRAARLDLRGRRKEGK